MVKVEEHVVIVDNLLVFFEGNTLNELQLFWFVLDWVQFDIHAFRMDLSDVAFPDSTPGSLKFGEI